MTPKQKSFADTLSLPELLATYARVHENHMCQFKDLAHIAARACDPLTKRCSHQNEFLVHFVLDSVKKMIAIGTPEMIDLLNYIVERMHNELGGNAPAAGGEQG